MLWLALAACSHPARADSRDGVDTVDTVAGDTDAADTDIDTDDTDTDAGDSDTDDTDTDVPSDWVEGDLASLPAFSTLHALPGGAAGVPVFTSNNPETFTSTGFLYEVARGDDVRGGASYPLAGTFGVYLHHHSDVGASTTLQLLVTNPGTSSITVSGEGSAYTNSERPLSQGGGPDYAVADDVLRDAPRTTVSADVAPGKAAAVWTATLADGAYVDGRFTLTASGPAYVYLIAAGSADPNDAVALTHTAASGDIHPPGDPPPPYGREAGVYAADTWQGAWTLDVPPAGRYAGYAVNTATGTGFPQVQAFPALTAFDDSSQESVGMYGDVYDLTVLLEPGDASASTVDVWLAAYGGGSPSFWFNGPVWVDGDVVPVWLAPEQVAQKVATVTVDRETAVHVRMPVPGLSSIPLGLFLVTR